MLFSPHVDLTADGLRDLPADHEDASVLRDLVHRITIAYLDGHPRDDPALSPLRADLSGLPPMLIQAASGDVVLRNARKLAERARRQGVDVRLEIYPGTTHAFQIYWSFLPEAQDALENVGEFVRGIAPSVSVEESRRPDSPSLRASSPVGTEKAESHRTPRDG